MHLSSRAELASNVVQVWLQTDKAAYLLRQYFFNNLHDRLSTRPFLSQIAKKWLAFQVTSLFFGVCVSICVEWLSIFTKVYKLILLVSIAHRVIFSLLSADTNFTLELVGHVRVILYFSFPFQRWLPTQIIWLCS